MIDISLCHARVCGSEGKWESALRQTEIHSLYCAFDAGALVALFICEKEVSNTRMTVLCKKGCI